MLKIKLLFFSLCVNTLFAQNIKILSKKDSLPIEGVILKYKETIFKTNKDGILNFNITNVPENDVLTISHVTYDNISINAIELKYKSIFFLDYKNNNIEEIIVSNKSKEINIYPLKSSFTFINLQKSLGLSPNLEASIYIPYKSEYENLKINGLKIEPLRGFNDKDDENKYLPFEVNLLHYDSINKIPSTKVFDNHILVKLEKGEQFINVMFPDSINFPKEGICVLLKGLSNSYYKKLTNKNNVKISFRSVSLSNNSEELLFFRFDFNDNFTRWISSTESRVKLCYYIGLKLIKKEDD